MIVSINRTQPAFTRLPWRGTPCPCFHARALLQVDIILTASKQLRIRHLNQYAAHLILTLRQYFHKIFYRLLTRCIQCIRVSVTMLPLIFGNIIVDNLKACLCLILRHISIIGNRKEPTVRVYRPDGRLSFVIFHVVIPLIRQSYNTLIVDYFSQ